MKARTHRTILMLPDFIVKYFEIESSNTMTPLQVYGKLLRQ